MLIKGISSIILWLLNICLSSSYEHHVAISLHHSIWSPEKPHKTNLDGGYFHKILFGIIKDFRSLLNCYHTPVASTHLASALFFPLVGANKLLLWERPMGIAWISATRQRKYCCGHKECGELLTVQVEKSNKLLQAVLEGKGYTHSNKLEM